MRIIKLTKKDFNENNEYIGKEGAGVIKIKVHETICNKTMYLHRMTDYDIVNLVKEMAKPKSKRAKNLMFEVVLEKTIECGRLEGGTVCYGDVKELGLPKESSSSLSGKTVKVTLNGVEYEATIK